MTINYSGKTVLIIGVVVLVLGLAAQIYTVTTTEEEGILNQEETKLINPYAGYSVPLMVGGIILIIAGIALKGNDRGW